VKLSQVIEELVEEKGLERTILSTIICEGMLAAYEKRYPGLVFKVDYDKKNDEIDVKVQKEVTASVADEDIEISLRKARNINPELNIGDQVWVPFDGKIGRIEILKAKQVIANKIRLVEAALIYDEFKSKQGTVVHCIIHKCEYGGATVKVDDTLAFLPKSLNIPGDKCIVGFPIRALLKEVLAEPRNDNQLILDRVSTLFIEKLFELEIPEVFEKLVEIKKIARIPGYKSKVLVVSHDKNIDPVGTCVGVGGVRIKPILKELGSEKIDIIAWNDSLEALVKDALKPAIISRVDLVDSKNAHVWLDEDQRSLAIGKGGQNIMLASQLVGLNIHLVQAEGQSGSTTEDKDLMLEKTFDEN
jgi:transcription termination/antitermination protein NusA